MKVLDLGRYALCVSIAAAMLAGCGSPGPIGAPGAAPNALTRQAESVSPKSVVEYAYVTNENVNNISGFSINATTGALTSVSGSPFATGTSPIGIAVDPAGKFVYAANANSKNVSGYSINTSTGALTQVPGSPFAAGSHPVAAAVDPKGLFAYVPNVADSTVSAYTINASTGALANGLQTPRPLRENQRG